MYSFFRRYQKIIFIFITGLVISSFVFFGTFSVIMDLRGTTREDRVIGKAIDGSDLKLLEISAMARFLGADRDDVTSGSTPNLLNDGVIRRDLIGSGVAAVLVKDSLDLLKNDLSQRIHRIKNFKGYAHPDAPFVSARGVWERFAPELTKEWNELAAQEELNGETFGHLFKLYQLQSSLPAEWVRKILMMHEQQYKQVMRPDPNLRNEDLALFGFHSTSDWFGKDFVDLMAEFVHNAAIAAAEKGYVVSAEEAKGDMHRIFTETMQKLKEAKWPGQFSYKDQLQMLGMDESEAVSIWRKVLLFRRYFQDVGESVFMDRLPQEEFASIAKEKAIVDLYQWPAPLHLKSAVDLFAFQTYVESVAGKWHELLPNEVLALSEVEKKTPELVETNYRAKVFAVDKREVSLRATIKEVWEFETQTETWELLKKEFPFLQALSAKNAEERFASLGKIESGQRSKVDFFARRLLVNQHPEWVKEALDVAEAKDTSLSLSAGAIRMAHVENPEKLAKLFEQIPESIEALAQFESGEAVFRFDNVEKVSEPKVKTFQEALADGSLLRIVDKKLEAKWKKLSPEKEFTAAKEEIAEKMLKAAPQSKIEGSIGAKRMAAIAEKAREDLIKNPHDPKWLKQEGDSPLLAQFKLERIEKQITRTAEENWMTKEPFILVPKAWSPIHVADDDVVFFLQLQNREVSNEPVLDQVLFGKEILVADVHRVLAERISAIMQKKHAVVIPVQTE